MDRVLRMKRFLLTVTAALPAACLWAADFIANTIKAAFCIFLVLLIPAPLSTASLVGTMRAKNPSATGNNSTSSSVSGGSSTDSTAAALAERQSLVRTTQTIAAVRAVQAAARAAAKAGSSSVPNGLTPGGLVVASGATFDSNGNSTNTGLWQGGTRPTQSTSGGQTIVDIKQQTSQAIFTWDSFNVGKDTTLNFDQKGNTDWIALNRLTDANASPSQILGNINADGQVYIINRNGIIFGGASQVNVHTLVASALPLNDVLWNSGAPFSS
jgi:filamentous hemagglutinin family protein